MDETDLAPAETYDVSSLALSVLLDDLDSPAVLLDRDGTLVFANRMAETLHGAQSADLARRNVAELRPALWATFYQEQSRLLEGVTVDVTFRDAPPSAAPTANFADSAWRVRWHPVLGGDALIAAIGTAMRVDEPARELSAEEQARASRRVIEDLAHELRGPTTTTMGFAQRILRKRDELPPDILEAVVLIAEASEEIAARIDSIVEDADPAGSRAHTASDVTLCETIRRECEALRGRWPVVEVDFDCPETLVVRTDPHGVREVIENLLENAARYGGGRVAVSVTAEGREVAVEVSDDGDGVPLPDRALIFKRGVRGRSVGRGGPQSFGLGLYIARERAHALGGSLELVSGKATGATFRFRLPLDTSPWSSTG